LSDQRAKRNIRRWRELVAVMPDFAIDPPVHVGKPETIVRSVEQAADFVRNCDLADFAGDTPGLLERLQHVRSPEQAQDAGRAFKAWLEKRDLLLVPPDAP
jgi:hypothetical protein